SVAKVWCSCGSLAARWGALIATPITAWPTAQPWRSLELRYYLHFPVIRSNLGFGSLGASRLINLYLANWFAPCSECDYLSPWLLTDQRKLLLQLNGSPLAPTNPILYSGTATKSKSYRDSTVTA